jgi:hypothetical protein
LFHDVQLDSFLLIIDQVPYAYLEIRVPHLEAVPKLVIVLEVDLLGVHY